MIRLVTAIRMIARTPFGSSIRECEHIGLVMLATKHEMDTNKRLSV
jgi:hypothetical protein